MDALTFACRGDVDKALSLNPEDYEAVDFNYDLRANAIISGRDRGRKTGKLMFISLKKSS